MEPISLSILVVNCKNYVPSHDWYLCKSGVHFSAAAKTPDWPDYDEARHNEFNECDDYDDNDHAPYVCHLCGTRR